MLEREYLEMKQNRRSQLKDINDMLPIQCYERSHD